MNAESENKVRLSEKISYLLTSYGYISVSSIISMFILYYYTDVALIAPAAVSVMLFAVRFFDGGIDPFIGHFMDRRKTKHGKYKGYLIYWSLPFCVASALVFAPSPFGGEGAKIIWHALIYLIWSFCYSIIETANLPLLVVITGDAKQRYSVNSAKILGGILASLAARYLALRLVGFLGGGDEARGYALATLLFSAIAFFAIQFPARHITERNNGTAPAANLLKTAHSIIKNKKIVFMLLFFFAHQTASSVKGQAAIYYMKYIVNEPSLTALFLITSTLSSLAMQPLIILLAKRASNRVLIVSGYIGSALGIAVMGIAGASVPALFAGNILYGVTVAFPANLTYVYVAELADGNKGANSATLHSFLGLVSRIAVALGGSLIALVLSVSDYVPNLAQSSGSQAGIKFVFITLTMVLYFSAALLSSISFGLKNEKEL